MTLHGLNSNLKPEWRLPLLQPFDPDETDLLQKGL